MSVSCLPLNLSEPSPSLSPWRVHVGLSVLGYKELRVSEACGVEVGAELESTLKDGQDSLGPHPRGGGSSQHVQAGPELPPGLGLVPG